MGAEAVDSHTFELTPSGAVKVQNADLVIINGLHLLLHSKTGVSTMLGS
ncbi:MAG: hypothetical protein WBQ25_20790 [Nitrososphaeraceae archaeon]